MEWRYSTRTQGGILKKKKRTKTVRRKNEIIGKYYKESLALTGEEITI